MIRPAIRLLWLWIFLFHHSQSQATAIQYIFHGTTPVLTPSAGSYRTDAAITTITLFPEDEARIPGAAAGGYKFNKGLSSIQISIARRGSAPQIFTSTTLAGPLNVSVCDQGLSCNLSGDGLSVEGSFFGPGFSNGLGILVHGGQNFDLIRGTGLPTVLDVAKIQSSTSRVLSIDNNVMFNQKKYFDYRIDNLSLIARSFTDENLSCGSVLNGSVKVGFSGPTISATFMPNAPSLATAAQVCGFNHFNWAQTVVNDPYPLGNAQVPYIDPIRGQALPFSSEFADQLPFYWNDLTNGGIYDRSSHETLASLEFVDTPQEPRLKPGEYLGFTTALVGIRDDGSYSWLQAFGWKSNFTGSTGSSASRATVNPDLNLSGSSGGIYDITSPSSVPELNQFVMWTLGLSVLVIRSLRRRTMH